MKNYLDFDDVFIKVDEIYSNGYPGYVCAECGKSFLVLGTDLETGDFNILYNDRFGITDLGCAAHINFDLIADPTFGLRILVPTKHQDHLYLLPAFAGTFLKDRLN